MAPLLEIQDGRSAERVHILGLVRADDSSLLDSPVIVAVGPEFNQCATHRPLRPVRLAVVEKGTLGFDEHSRRDAGAPTVRLEQDPLERPKTFALRTVKGILALEQSGMGIDAAILLLAPRFDAETTAARLIIARGLITHCRSLGLGASELLIRAGSPSPGELRASLAHLLDALVSEPGSWALRIQAPVRGAR